jgi:anaerobic ribonucleoside-triphosphate reductase activating protein
VFVQGCPHRCKGCHNPASHDYDGGVDTPIDEIAARIQKNPLLSGVTYSGGEPFLHAAALAALSDRVHAMGLNVWCYTGYTYDELLQKAASEPDTAALLSSVDILVDGRFEDDKKDLTLVFRGSSNQRLINLKAMREARASEIILLK